MTGLHPSGRSDDELRSALAAAMASFAEAVGAIDADDWDRDSPCDGWTVADVVDHVVMGDVFAAEVLGGSTLDEAVQRLHGIGSERAGAADLVTEAAGDALAAFAGPLDRLVEHPVGRITARQFIGYRVLDQLGHSWDVRRGTRQSELLPDIALQVAVDVARVELPMLNASNHFATHLDSDDSEATDMGSTFLRLIGRCE